MRVLLITFGVLITFFSYSQSIERQVIAGSGGFFTGGNHSMSFTLGEAVTATFSNGSYIITQGFQQPGGDTLSNSLLVKVFLQGPYAGAGLMNTTIMDNGYLPNTQPFNMHPFYYTGSEAFDSLPGNAVDWVLAELRITPDTIVAQRAGILLANGIVVDTTGQQGLFFDGLVPGMYYLVIRHRNHMPVMTAVAVAVPGFNIYNLSDTLALPLYGGGQAGIELESNITGMIAGDINQDGLLKYSGPSNDRSLILQRIVAETGSTSITTTIDGYYYEDVNLNATLKYSGPGNDPSRIIQNLVHLTGSTSITSVFHCPVPYGVLK